MARLDLKTPPTIALPQLEFPDSDGRPMGETGIHVKQILDLLAALLLHFRDRPDVYAGADMFVYYDPTDPAQNFCPDVFVALGVKPGERRSWKMWEEGKVPDVIIEITSKGTRLEDTREKRALYEDLGVREYFLFDPLDEYLKPRLQGYRQVGGAFQRLASDALISEVLGVELRIKEADDRLHLFDPKQNDWLLTPQELFERAEEARARTEEERRRAEEERARTEEERRRADEERRRADEERARADAAEGQVARLRAEIARLRGEQ